MALEVIDDVPTDATEPAKAFIIYTFMTGKDVSNMVHRGSATADILDGIHRSIAGRLARLLRAVQADGTLPVAASLSQNWGIIRVFEASVAVHTKRQKKVPTVVMALHVQSQVAGAIGAALLAAWRTQQLERMGCFEVVGSAT